MDVIVRASAEPRDQHLIGFSSAASRRWLCVAAITAVAFLVVAGAVWYASGPTGFDVTVAVGVVAARTSLLTGLAAALTTAGAFPAVVSVALVVALVLWLRTGRLLLPLTLLITVAETAATVYLLKQVVGRERPPSVWLIGAPSADGSFPSGHTTNGSVVYLLAGLFLAGTFTHAWIRRLLIAAAVAASVVIGLTRVCLGYHWASDVLGGWLLAVAICATAAFAVCRLGPGTGPVDADRLAAPTLDSESRMRS